MADFETGDVVRLGCVQQLLNLGAVVNVLHLQITAGGGLDFAAAAQDFQEYCDGLYATISSGLVDEMDPDHISVKNVSQAAVWGNIAWDVYAGGANASDMTAPQVAVLCWGRTSISRVQIRKYLGVFPETYMVDGIWGSPVRALCQNYIDYHIVGQVMANGLVLRGCAYRPVPARVTFAVTGTTAAAPVIQRRRRQGRGS